MNSPKPAPPASEKCQAVSRYGCICLLDEGHEGNHDPKCGWSHKFAQTEFFASGAPPRRTRA